MNRTVSFALVSAALALSSVACAVDSAEGQALTGEAESAVVSGPGTITSAPDPARCGGSCKVTDPWCGALEYTCKKNGCGIETIDHPGATKVVQCVAIPAPPSSGATRPGTIDDFTSLPDPSRCSGSCNTAKDDWCGAFEYTCKGNGCGTTSIDHPLGGKTIQCVAIPTPPSSGATRPGTIGDITSAPDPSRCSGSCNTAKDDWCGAFEYTCKGNGCGTTSIDHPLGGKTIQCVSIPPRPSN